MEEAGPARALIHLPFVALAVLQKCLSDTVPD